MFCYQCQETAGNHGCTKAGVCGKTSDVSNLQDLLIYVTKGISYYALIARKNGIPSTEADKFVVEALFTTVTNVNFDQNVIEAKIKEGLSLRNKLKQTLADANIILDNAPDAAVWEASASEDLAEKASKVGLLATENEDIRSLQYMLIYGVKGMAAYYHHAAVLGFEDAEIMNFMEKALAATLENLSGDDCLICSHYCCRLRQPRWDKVCLL
jgi:hydroxylamine reductase